MIVLNRMLDHKANENDEPHQRDNRTGNEQRDSRIEHENEGYSHPDQERLEIAPEEVIPVCDKCHWDKDDKLQSSGLIGPVTLRCAKHSSDAVVEIK